ncbi:hypothetical protein MTR67_035854 [Solanum verrucosum]|uniref:40S ribosomal protein S25 n=1 Tax=Solanum verrucosum TaxID=315347 RepID=A0AAF0ZMP3_SOLVR|nr:hypothetical protein MTR67_035854 [Solanum verrucosum]
MAPRKAQAPPPSSKPAKSGGGKQKKKKKWSKGKQKEKMNNMVLFDNEKDGRVVHFLGIQVPILRRINSLGGGIGRNGGVCHDRGNCREYVYGGFLEFDYGSG